MKITTRLLFACLLVCHLPIASFAQQVSASIINVVHVKCFGDCNGSATASVTGGTTPYTYTWSDGQKGITATGLCAGNYTFTVRDAGGDTYQVGVAINQPPKLNIAVSATQATCGTCPNGTASATGTGGTGSYTYSWSNGATTNPATGLLPGVYTVCITDANGCTACNVVTVSFTNGIAKNSAEKVITVSPNPSTGLFNLELKSAGSWHIEVMNVIGKRVLTLNEETDKAVRKTIDLTALPEGVYILSVTNSGLTHTARIIKQ